MLLIPLQIYVSDTIKWMSSVLSQKVFFPLQDSWVKDLEVRVEKFLTLTLKSRPQPKLFELYVSL